MKTDILIAGSGCSGLYCALQLPRDKKITIITKSDLTSNDSYLAQGGMCMLKEQSDYDSFFEDTMKAGHYENDKESVDIMIRTAAFPTPKKAPIPLTALFSTRMSPAKKSPVPCFGKSRSFPMLNFGNTPLWLTFWKKTTIATVL